MKLSHCCRFRYVFGCNFLPLSVGGSEQPPSVGHPIPQFSAARDPTPRAATASVLIFSNTRSRRWKSRQAELGCLRGSLPAAADTSASICNTYLSLECSELRSSSLQRPISPFAHSFAPRRCRPPPNSCPGACTLACCCSRNAESRLAMPFHSANTSSSGPGTFDGKPC